MDRVLHLRELKALPPEFQGCPPQVQLLYFEEPVAQGRLHCAARYDSAGGGIQRPPVMLQPSQQQDWIKDVGDSDSQSEFGIEHLLVAN